MTQPPGAPHGRSAARAVLPACPAGPGPDPGSSGLAAVNLHAARWGLRPGPGLPRAAAAGTDVPAPGPGLPGVPGLPAAELRPVGPGGSRAAAAVAGRRP